MGAPGTSKIPKTTQAPAIHGAPEPTSDLSTRAKRFERRRGRKEVGPYPVLHDGLEPDELGDAVVLGGGEPRLERRSADSCAMFNMTSAYAFLSASTCAKEEPVRPRGGRTDGVGGGRVPGAEFHLGGSHFGKFVGGGEGGGALAVARALVLWGAAVGMGRRESVAWQCNGGARQPARPARRLLFQWRPFPIFRVAEAQLR
jgi:hypothetical protein